MINVNVAQSNKCNGNYSAYLSFHYDERIINVVRGLSDRAWHSENKTWEIPYASLADVLIQFVDHDIQLQGDIYAAEHEHDEKEVDLAFNFKTTPYSYQLDGFKYGLTHDNWLLGDEQGLGKALALNTKVYTPTGYKLMRDIEVGDSVFAKDGTPTKVLAVYNHHNVEMYRITFSDGVSVECCKDHLWEIHDVHGRKVVDTKWFTEKDQFGKIRMNNLSSKGYGYKYWIDRCNPVQFEYQKVPVNPYVLGALLGDGGLTSNSISFTTADEEMVKNINDNLREGYVLSSSKSMINMDYNIIGTKGRINTIKQDLKALGLWGTNSHTKFIPDLYKYNSISVRTQVLQGLIDTDGYATNDNLLQYTTVSKQLCEDVRFLAESLGGIVSYSEKPCGYGERVTGVCYTLTLKFDRPQLYCTLTRKKRLLKDRHFKARRNIVSVERIENADAKCITVDNAESLYLIDHFVVTHNTKQVIDIACAKKEREGYQHVLIICGVNGLKWNWLNEIHTHSDEDGYIIGQKARKNGKLYIGSNEDKLACLNDIDSLPYFIITNVESLRYGVKTGNMIKKRVKGVLREIQEVIYPITDKLVELCNEGKINLIAFDEMHKCKNTQSQQGEQTLRLNAQNNIAMTGTPLMNKPMDLYAILKWLGYEKHSLYQFTQHYCMYGGFEGHEVVGYKNLDELEAHLNSVMLRRRKEDVLDLPEKTFIDEYVEMTPKQTRLYNEVLNALRMDIDKIKLSHNPLTQIIRLRQVTGYTGIVSSEVQESAKIDRLCELAEDIVANGKKFVVFSNWTQMTDVIRERLSMYRPAVVTGETKDEDRIVAMNTFQNDVTCKCIIGTVGALGTGFTLTAGTNVIFVDEPWTQAMKDQAIDRCHRIGTTENVTVYTLLTKDTIDERVNDIVKQKGMLADTIVDGKPVDTDALVDYLLS